jgi:UDP-N-acetylmuramyl pentapeptide synthase
MAALHAVLSEEKRGGLWATAEEAIPSLLGYLEPGDIVMVKASHGVHAECIVEALMRGRREPET